MIAAYNFQGAYRSAYSVNAGMLTQPPAVENASQMLLSLGFDPEAAEELSAALSSQLSSAKELWAGFSSISGSSAATPSLSELYGKGLPPSQHVPRPEAIFERAFKLYSKMYSMPPRQLDRKKLDLLGLSPKQYRKQMRKMARTLERMTRENPAVRTSLERLVGGHVVMDGRVDGKLTVQRYQAEAKSAPLSNRIANDPKLSRIYNHLARYEGNLETLMKDFTNLASNKAGSTTQAALKDPQTAEMADGMGMSPPMSFEDILFLLMLKYAKNKEKQIMGKAQELMRASDQAAAQQNNPNANVVNNNVVNNNAVNKNAVNNAAATNNYNPMDPNQSDTTRSAMLQKMMNDLQKVYTLLSNVMKSMHDMQMASVRNIR